MTLRAIYAGSNCTQPILLQYVFGQCQSSNTTCENFSAISTSASCVQTGTFGNYAASFFGSTPFISYTICQSQNCSNAASYVSNVLNACFTNGTYSLSANSSAISEYPNSSCSGSANIFTNTSGCGAYADGYGILVGVTGRLDSERVASTSAAASTSAMASTTTSGGSPAVSGVSVGSSDSGGLKSGAIAGVAVGAVLAVAGAVCLFVWFRRRAAKTQPAKAEGASAPGGPGADVSVSVPTIRRNLPPAYSDFQESTRVLSARVDATDALHMAFGVVQAGDGAKSSPNVTDGTFMNPLSEE
ncbi:hypothetical protein HDU83_004956 [Entophlyctis luteolus]|nr:hypothetical protein HDU83_004956 [Entophlyctis luteolus]